MGDRRWCFKGDWTCQGPILPVSISSYISHLNSFCIHIILCCLSGGLVQHSAISGSFISLQAWSGDSWCLILSTNSEFLQSYFCLTGFDLLDWSGFVVDWESLWILNFLLLLAFGAAVSRVKFNFLNHECKNILNLVEQMISESRKSRITEFSSLTCVWYYRS